MKIQNPTCICDCSTLTLYVSQHVFFVVVANLGVVFAQKRLFDISEVIACQRAVIGTRWSAGDWEDTEDGADLGGGEKTWGNGQVTLGSDMFADDLWEIHVGFNWNVSCLFLVHLFGIIIAVKHVKSVKTKMFPTPFRGKK